MMSRLVPLPLPYHLGDTEAMLEVVEGDVVVAAVDLIEELLEDLHFDVEGGYEVQVRVHHLEQHHDLGVLPLPANEASKCPHNAAMMAQGVFKALL